MYQSSQNYLGNKAYSRVDHEYKKHWLTLDTCALSVPSSYDNSPQKKKERLSTGALVYLSEWTRPETPSLAEFESQSMMHKEAHPHVCRVQGPLRRR